MAMKKRIIYLIITMVLTIIMSSGCNKENSVISFKNNNVSRIEIQKGPNYKNITDSRDVELVIEKLKSIQYEGTQDIEGLKGHEFFFTLFNDSEEIVHRISMVDGLVMIDDSGYKIDSNVIDNIRSLYNELKYSEENIYNK